MTISAARTRSEPPRGFTLLEIVIVLVIIGVFVGGALGVMRYSPDERNLRDASGEIELLAKRARTTAILQQTPYAIEFRQEVVRMLPLAQAGQDERKKIGGREIGGEIVQVGNVEKREFPVPAGMRISVRRWNSNEFEPTAKDTVHIWRFDPDGLCEPLSVRLSLDQSWAEDTYHPLTANVRESLLEAR